MLIEMPAFMASVFFYFGLRFFFMALFLFWFRVYVVLLFETRSVKFCTIRPGNLFSPV